MEEGGEERRGMERNSWRREKKERRKGRIIEYSIRIPGGREGGERRGERRKRGYSIRIPKCT